MSKKEIKIFLSSFILYSFFVHWGGWYEDSMFALTRAIVEEQRFAIDSWANQTSDRAFFNDHYYTDKAPGTSFLATPVYGLWRLVYSLFPKSFVNEYKGNNDYVVSWTNDKISIIKYINPGFFVLISMILVTIFTASLFSSLTVLLIYKISKYFTEKEKHRLLITTIYGVGGMAFPYGTLMFTHQVGLFLAVLSFYLLLRMKKEKIKGRSNFLLAGLAMGFAGTSDYPTVLIGILLSIYTLKNFKNKGLIFLPGYFLGLLPAVSYNHSILGTPFDFVARYNDRQIWTGVSEETFNLYGFVPPKLLTIAQILIGQYRGLFFYYPILFLSFLGLGHMFKKYRDESILFLVIFILFVLFTASRITWHGGYCFGPRFLLPSIPFLTLPLLFTFERMRRGRFKLLLILVGYSILVNLSSFQIMEDAILSRGDLLISDEYDSFSSFPNVLFGHYFPLFFKYGPRSLLFENILEGHVDIDIRERVPAHDWGYPHLANNHIPFLCLVPLMLVLSLIWIKETIRER